MIESLRRRVPKSEFFGVGGRRMRDAGFQTIVDAHKISVVGLAEVLTHLPMIRREFKRLVGEAKECKPDAAVLIDFPDFNLRLARELHKLNIPVFYYVSPQLWAWRQGRITQIQQYVRKMLVIFPFEEDFYRQHGVDVEYVGHPLADELRPTITRVEFALENNLDVSAMWIALLPGSRRKEVLLNLGLMLESAAQMRLDRVQFLLPVASSLDPAWIRSLIADAKIPVMPVRDSRAALLHSEGAIVASGTATLEAALIGRPFVMVYRVSRLTYALGRRLVKVKHFAMPNLIAGREIVPEFVQENFVPARVAQALLELLSDKKRREDFAKAIHEVRNELHTPGPGSAADRAANAILTHLSDSSDPRR